MNTPEQASCVGETWVEAEKCIGCGYSRNIAPEVYYLGPKVADRVVALNPSGELVEDGQAVPVTSEQLRGVLDVVKNCPVDAVHFRPLNSHVPGEMPTTEV